MARGDLVGASVCEAVSSVMLHRAIAALRESLLLNRGLSEDHAGPLALIVVTMVGAALTSSAISPPSGPALRNRAP